jgi:hypothetical protein
MVGSRVRLGTVLVVTLVAAAVAATVTALGPPGTGMSPQATADHDPDPRPPGIGAACPTPEVPPAWFEDIAGNTHEDAIVCAHWQRIVFGVLPTRYAPGADIPRDQAASILARALERAGAALPPPGRTPFRDLDGNVHADRISQLAQVGLVHGLTPDRFGPKAPISRGQIAALLVRFHEHVTDQALRERGGHYDDTEGTQHENAIEQATVAGIVAGTGPRTYEPAAPVRRDQLASLITRSLARLIEQGVTTPYVDPAFHAEVSTIPDDIRRWMTGSSWHPGCPVGLDDLRLLQVTHRGFDGGIHTGHLVVHRTVASDLVEVFRRIYDARFRIERIRLVDAYGADDDRSMAANNTHAFNCRRTTGGTRWSEHAYGWAIDINPVQNPYVRGTTVLPPTGRAYLDRSDLRLGMIVDGDPVVRAFDAIGWGWGGRWNSVEDHQHFSATGR